MPSTTLTTREQTTLTRLEKTIDGGLKVFWDVGKALMRIRDERLYRDEHESFAVYCSKRWGFQQRYANYLIKSSEVAGRLNGNNCSQKPSNELQARELAKAPEALQSEIWDAVVERAKETGKPITAGMVRDEVERERQARPATEDEGAEADGVQGDVAVEPIVLDGESVEVQDAAWAPCPNCGCTERDECGECPACHDPCETANVCDVAAETTKPKPAAVAPIAGLAAAVKITCRDWMDRNPETPAVVVASMLENLAVELRDL